MDPRLEAEFSLYDDSDERYVERVYRQILRRPPDAEALERALAKMGEGTLSRAALVQELATSDEFRRVREVDDAVALGLGLRARREPVRWLQAPPATEERVVEIPWVLSRLREGGRVLEVGYAYAEPAYLRALLQSGVEVVGVDIASRDVQGMETVEADVRKLPFADGMFDQVLLVSTLEHVGSDNSRYGVETPSDGEPPESALRELGRVLARNGELLATVPVGEPRDYGWFRQDDEAGWMRLFARGGFFVEETETYELKPDGWRAAAGFRAHGVRYGARGPGASAVLCAVLRPGRLRHLLRPGGLESAARRRARRVRARRAEPTDE
jgi:SAM-dependent methyltransferase